MVDQELPIVQRIYDLILWYVPCLNKMPRDTKFMLGDRIQGTLYLLLEKAITARYHREKEVILSEMDTQMDILRYQTRLCRDFQLLDIRRYEHVSKLIDEIGVQLGGWKRHHKQRGTP